MRVLVTGAGGTLGRRLVHDLIRQRHDPIACDRSLLDITDAAGALAVAAEAQPEVVVHCAAFTNVDAAEANAAEAFRVNAQGTANVARAAEQAGARFVYISTDYVFDGSASVPYRPGDTPNPLSVYGRSKWEGEQAARLVTDSLVVRVSWVYGRGGKNFGSQALRRARGGDTLRAFTDMRSTPTWSADAAATIIRLIESPAPAGTYHASNSGGATWYEFACAALAHARIEAEVLPTKVVEVGLPAPRPAFSVLDVSATEALIGPIRGWQDALAAAIEDGL